LFFEEIAVPGTIFTGFNNVRFDDEFMRYAMYRNFYDPYVWQWQDDRSRWDLLDVARMTRALRPDGIKWPFEPGGKPSNRLEYLTKINKLEHANAHDALADVLATIDVARLIKQKQPKLFDYLLGVRGKQKIAELVGGSQPFVYTSGKYPAEFEKTTVVVKVVDHPERGGALVYDLRHDPADWLDKTPQEIAKAWQWNPDPEARRLPVKALLYNRCPAVAPLGVLRPEDQERLSINMAAINKNLASLRASKDFGDRLVKAMAILNKQQQTRLVSQAADVDGRLYDGFFDKREAATMSAVRAADPRDIAGFADRFKDQRLKALVPLYKARNYPASLTDEERQVWEDYRLHKLTDGRDKSRLANFFKRLEELAADQRLSPKKRYLLEELQLYAESIMPAPDFAG
jgi:exodeoxyribonuclease-1